MKSSVGSSNPIRVGAASCRERAAKRPLLSRANNTSNSYPASPAKSINLPHSSAVIRPMMRMA